LTRDRFDILAGVGIGVVLLATLLLVLRSGSETSRLHSTNAAQAAERALRQRAQAALLAETYAPVEALITEGRLGEALLQLEQVERNLPGEAHTALLRGGILVRQGAQTEGLGEYVRAVQLRADYVDTRSPLQRREEIEALLKTALPDLQRRIQASPDNTTLAKALYDVRYLQSRLAGGCE